MGFARIAFLAVALTAGGPAGAVDTLAGDQHPRQAPQQQAMSSQQRARGDLGSDNPVARAAANIARRQFAQALGDLDEAVAKAPADPVPLNGRGLVHYLLRQYPESLADYDRAIALDPAYAPAYGARGDTWRAMRQYDRAVQDYAMAMTIDPGLATPLGGLAIVAYLQGDFPRAAALSQSLIAKDGLNHRRALFRFAARSRAGENAGAELAEAQAALPPAIFPAAATRLLLNQAGPRAVEATEEEAAMPQDEWQTVANYVLGLHALLQGDRAAAAESFRRATATGATSMIDYQLAEAELARLRAQP